MSKKKISFWLVGYSIFILMIGTNIPSPLYAVYKANMQFSSLTLTLIFATYAIVLIPSLALFGKMSDKFGRKKVIWSGVLVSVIGSVVFLLSTSIACLFAARIFQGLSVGILSGAATASLMELNPYQDKKVAALMTSVATAGGTALGPVIGGIIAQYGSAPLKLPFYFHLLIAIPCLFGLLTIEETVQRSKSITKTSKQVTTEMPKEIKTPFMASAITAFLAWSVTALFMSIMPSYVSALLHIKNLALTGGIVFLMLGSSVAAQFVTKNLIPYTSMKTGLLCLTLGLIGITTAVPLSSSTILFIATIVTGAGQGLAFKGSLEQINSIAPTDQRGAIVSKLYVVIYIGVGLPIIGVGALVKVWGLYIAIFIFTGLITVVSLLMVFILLKRFLIQYVSKQPLNV